MAKASAMQHDMAYTPPSNNVQRVIGTVHERAVKVIAELLARTGQSGFCLHTPTYSGAHPTRVVANTECSARLSRGSGSGRP